jgi:DNA-binding beta-propeller fold protein YncE
MRQLPGWLAVWAITVSSAAAQAPALAGPQVGLVIDPASGAIRPVEGILGGASVGPMVASAVPLAGRAVSPLSDYVLAVSARDLALWVAQPSRTGSAGAAAIPGAMRAPDAIAISPAGSHAAVYNGASAQLQVLKGLPSAPAVDRTIDLSSLSGSLTALAVSEDGAAVLAAISESGGGAVYRITGQGIAAPVVAAAHVTAMAFSGHGNAAAADAANNLVWLITDVAGAAGATPLAGAGDGVDAPVGIAFSADSGAVYVANASSNAVLVLNLAGGAPRSLPCACNLTTLQPVGRGAFRLTDSLRQALWFLDASGAEPRLAFVPPPQPQVRAPGAVASRGEGLP